MDTTTLVPLLVTLLLGVALGALVGVLWARGRRPDDAVAALEAGVADRAVVREGLDRLEDRLRDLDRHRVAWQSRFDEQVEEMRRGTDVLRRETSSLATALRKPQVRGRWGEMHLRRAVELAGLVERCDFTEQQRLDDGALRPDLVVHLTGGRCVVVDSKVPLEAFLDATEAEDDDERAAHLARHARQVRTHAEQLAAKSYWRSLDTTPEFVVMFLPAEAFLAAALDSQADLLDHAAQRRVVLATPTTLIALLRTVAQGWSHEALAEQAQEVQRLGRELHERLATMGSHVDKVGRSLAAAVAAYNSAVGSLESRVLVTARKFGELGGVDDDLATPRAVEEAPRSLAAPELTLFGEPGGSDLPEPRDDAAPARRARGA